MVHGLCLAQGEVPEWSRAARERLFGPANAADVPGGLSVQRRALLDDGERLLAAGRTEEGHASFERAAMLLHAPDTEAALVRSHMQAGHYRQALAFGAHAAGAHRREWPAGQALYAWLLHVGGQGVVARRLLDDALALAPDDAALRSARAQLGMPWPRADSVLRERPLTVAPYAVGETVAASAAVAGSGLLLPGGERALVPLSVLGRARHGGSVWLRNGLGQTVLARPEQLDEGLGLALLRLSSALPAPALEAAPREPFGGSPGYMVEYAAQDDGAAAWPLLRQGFFARVSPTEAARPLGIEAPAGPRGGPVFDGAGRLAGVAITAADATARLLPVSRLAERFGLAWSRVEALQPAALPTPRADVDAVYERALHWTLQVLVVE